MRIEALAELGELALVAAETRTEDDTTAVQTLERGELLGDDVRTPAR